MKHTKFVLLVKILFLAASLVGAAGCTAALLPNVQKLIINLVEVYIRGAPLESDILAKWLPVITTYAQTGIFLILFADICVFILPSKAASVCIKKINTHPYIFLILCVMALEAVFFRDMIFCPDALIGTDGDGRLVNLILEHWYRVFTFKAESPGAVPYFAPLKSTLGFTDTFFVYSIPYTLLRLAGLDWMSAAQLCWPIVHITGGIALSVLLKRCFGLPVYAVFIALVIGNYSNAYYLATVHPQMFSLSFIPLIAIFIFELLANFNNKRKRITYTAVTIAAFAILAFSTFYMAFFFAFFLIIAFWAFFVRKASGAVRRDGNYRPKLRAACAVTHAFLRQNIKELLFYAVFCVVCLLPFLLTYIPAMKEQAKVSMGMLLTTPQYFTLFNVSPANILWGFPHVESAQGTEAVTGLPFITLVLAILGTAFYITHKKQIHSLPIRILFYSSISLCVILLLITRFNNNFTFWFFINRFFPGASVLRALSRFYLFFSFPLSLIISCFLASKLNGIANRYLKYFAAFTLCLFIFVEHQNAADIARWKKPEQRAFINSIPPPPQDCRYFALVDKRHSRTHENAFEAFFKPANLDAFTIATLFNLKTINGYSGFDPKNWTQPFYDDEGMRELAVWVKQHNLQNVYIYEASENIWMPFNAALF
jgi:hypothetical protein